MPHPAQRLVMLKLSRLLGLLAALADIAAALVLVRARRIEASCATLRGPRRVRPPPALPDCHGRGGDGTPKVCS